ncbi:MAG: hypothetical protein JO079_08140 [Frankiaceae bacterium]|nr:hypothetical protein [Frankiaceae bacterium]MBV9368667.1 hypothetical protein [Frankiales bacterium]
MTDIEELVRESLRTAPAVVPSVSDPVAAVTGRVRRARTRWAGGAVAVVAVLAAVVVPVSLDSGTSVGGRVVPAGSPSASYPPGVTEWQSSDAVAVTAGGGWLWELERNPKASDGSGYVVKVDPRTHEHVAKWDVAAPYNQLMYGGGVVWVWSTSTHSDMVSLGGLVQAVDLTQADVVGHFPVQLDRLDNLTILDQPSGVADALVVVGRKVVQLRARGGGISEIAMLRAPSDETGAVAATGAGDYWVSSGGQLLELDLVLGADSTRLLYGQPKKTVPWSGGLFGPAGPDAIWATDGTRLVALSPSLLDQGVSVAEGDRISLPGYLAVLVPDGAGGVFVSIESSQVAVSGERPGLYHVSKALMESGAAGIDSAPALPGITASELVAVGGGVDFASDSGAADHWQP